MKIYYYHTRPIVEAYNEWLEHKHPGHILYGLTHFEQYGIQSVLHPFKKEKSRIGFMVRNFFQILRCKEDFDVLYATSFRGLELIVFLRALGLYKKPLAVWHHTAIISSSNKFKNNISRFFYKGFDQLFFFNTRLIDLSQKTGKVSKERMHCIHWGADLNFYDQLLQETGKPTHTFISTGKENRDFSTLIKAFEESTADIDVFLPKTNGNIDYQKVIGTINIPKNVHLKFVGGIIPHEMAVEVARSQFVAICCCNPPYSYTVGLTTLVEALALGKPIICSDNPFWEMDLAKEHAGITVPYYDVEGWRNAVRLLSENKDLAEEMGKNARKMAERKYNLEYYAKEVADILKSML